MNPLSIVIVDDLHEIQLLVSHWLSADGHSVTCASGGKEAGHLLREKEYDLVITDMLMPDGDGVEVLTTLKKTQPRARVLAISGGGTYLRAHDVLNVARGFGANGVLTKPFNRTQLLAAVKQAMESDGTPATAPHEPALPAS
jgi:two-component system, chemotaxis family, chemotaxis protein CheY